jgi:hypothetical protein
MQMSAAARPMHDMTTHVCAFSKLISDSLYLLQCFFLRFSFSSDFCLPFFRFSRMYYAQDKTDDAKIGMRSTALLFGDRVCPILAGFGALTIGALCAAGAGGGCGPGTFISPCTAPTLAGTVVCVEIHPVFTQLNTYFWSLASGMSTVFGTKSKVFSPHIAFASMCFSCVPTSLLCDRARRRLGAFDLATRDAARARCARLRG